MFHCTAQKYPKHFFYSVQYLNVQRKQVWTRVITFKPHLGQLCSSLGLLPYDMWKGYYLYMNCTCHKFNLKQKSWTSTTMSMLYNGYLTLAFSPLWGIWHVHFLINFVQEWLFSVCLHLYVMAFTSNINCSSGLLLWQAKPAKCKPPFWCTSILSYILLASKYITIIYAFGLACQVQWQNQSQFTTVIPGWVRLKDEWLINIQSAILSWCRCCSSCKLH